MFLYIPVVKRVWKQYELWDGTYIFDDLLDIHEAIVINEGNKALLIQQEVENSKMKDEALYNI